MPRAPQEEHNRHREQAVHRPRHLRQLRPAIGAARKVDGDEDEGLDAPRIESSFFSEAAGVANLLVPYLEHQLHVLPGIEQTQLPLRELVLGVLNL